MDAPPEDDGTLDPLAPWWGVPVRFAQDQVGHWRIGARSLWIARRPQEWRLVTCTSDDPHDETRAFRLPCAAPPPPEAEVQRFAASQLSTELHLGVRLADRRVVVRPEAPFELLAGESVDLYLGTSAWITVTDPQHPRVLFECPVVRPSDTWLGPSPLSGELAYASRTRASLSLADVPRRPGRAVTRLCLQNRSGKAFSLTRVALPMRALALWEAPDHRLFTDALTFVIGDDGAGEVRIQGSGMADAIRLCEPREAQGRYGIRHALGLLFG